MSDTLICGLNYGDFVVRMEEFHGYRSPGILVGALMIEDALKEVGTTPYLNVVTETIVCLPDAVQLLTPCTIGNGFLQVLDWGKFALTAYDRRTLAGIRAWLNYDALVNFPLIHTWFKRSSKTTEKPAFEELAKDILKAGSDLVAQQPVRLHQALKNSERVPTGRCPNCGESYPLHFGPTCPACGGKAYFEYLSSD
ncbi:MAG: FmdE family protein [Desulfobacterales bacterium]|jgi:formylmethanofuran dehydrogenase subunit E